ncbi:uncharacterized protein LOC143450096 [Clavelina lepadiformis]|uniref:uncharacterized protein LOC143450096 n=1 Tax=Clavelina lepadiformis TaxID=159417 RepID=UPI004041C9CD
MRFYNTNIRGFKSNVFQVGRVVFGLCILADACWYMISFEVRSAYFRELRLPIAMLYVLMITYLFFGLRLLINFSLENTCLAMIITYSLVGFLVHHPVGEGGIGDYPRHINGEMNFLQVLAYEGLVGGLLVMFGFSDMESRRKIMHGSKSYAIVLGRAVIALHFLGHTFYFKLIQYSLRSKQITMMGGSPFFHIFIIGSIHVIASYFAWLGNPNQRRLGALSLAITTVLMSFVENSTLATSLGVYHMKPEARIHQFIVQIGIATGCLLLYSTGGIDAQPYKKNE